MKTVDIRIALLEKLNSLKNGASEFIANEFLSSLHDDLGTIKRMLIELIDSDLIIESNVTKSDHPKSIIWQIDTTAHDNDPERDNKKSSKRLIRKVGNSEKIQCIRLLISLKGMNFLIENAKLKNELKLSRWQRYWFWPVALIALLSLAISAINFLQKIFCG
jgi:hypothetical protein